MKKQTIGVIGHGFVGGAVQRGMMHAFDVLVHDPFKYPEGCRPEHRDARDAARAMGGDIQYVGFGVVTSIEELCRRANVIFVCLPTPMRPDGSCDTSNVEGAVKELAYHGKGNVVVIKSTVPPGTTAKLDADRRGLRGVVFNPEFLTEANADEDFKNQTRIIIGGEDPAKSIVKKLYATAYPKVPTIKTSSTIAEMVKYMTNCFLATKLSFANEMYQVCEKLGVDYDKVVEYARYDERLGNSHWAVPGPDGSLGWGLSCFPKDLNALMFKARELGIDPKVMSAVWQKNLEVRRNRDWEKMSKAVTNPIRDPDKSIT